MSNDTLLEIQDSFTIRGRGLCLISKIFLSVIPAKHSQPFTDTIAIIKPNGASDTCEAHFYIEHFSLITNTTDISGRFSLVILLPGKSTLEVPAGSCVKVNTSQLNRIQAMLAQA